MDPYRMSLKNLEGYLPSINFIRIILRPAYISINFVWRDYPVSWVNPMNLCILSIQPVKLKEKVFLVIVSICLS